MQQSLKGVSGVPSNLEVTSTKTGYSKGLFRSLKSFSVDLRGNSTYQSQNMVINEHKPKYNAHGNMGSVKAHTPRIKNTFEEFKEQTDMHALHQAYRNLRVHTHESHSTFNSTASGSGATFLKPLESGGVRSQFDCLMTQQSDDNASVSKNVQGEYSNSYLAEFFSTKRHHKSNILFTYGDISTLETEEQEYYVPEPKHDPTKYITHKKPRLDNNNELSSLGPEFRKLKVCKPEFFYLPRKLLNDDRVPELDEDSMEYSYLDLGSYGDRSEPKEIIHEVDEEEESGIQNKTSLLFRTSKRTENYKELRQEQEGEDAESSVIIKQGDFESSFGATYKNNLFE